MKILAIDTTTKTLCLGLFISGKFYEYRLETARNLSDLLVPTIGRVLAALELKIADLDYFACGLGPGSFTGMRIGLATIKGFSVVRNKPVIGISTLDILAKNSQAKDRLIVPVVDARRELIYCSSYKYQGSVLKRQSPYLLLTVDELVKKFNSRAVFLGDALALYQNKISASVKNASFLDKDYWSPQAHNLMELALSKIKAKQFTSVLKVKPIYLYPKECQIKTR